jgi:MerR family transcriptional regulator, copper efflux regulator
MESSQPLNIGQAADMARVSAKMIRHYESLGLLPKVRRTGAGYRQYTMNEVQTLRFIRRARDLGFGIGEIAALLNLWQNHRRASAEVKKLALAHAAELDTRIAEMQAMKRTLEQLAAHCHGDDRPECPILEDLAAPGDAPDASRRKSARVLPGKIGARAPRR